MSYQDELISLPSEITLESPASLIAATLAPLRDQKVAYEEVSDYMLIGQRLKAIQEILWVNPQDERVEQLVRSAILTLNFSDSQRNSLDSIISSLEQLHDLIKTTHPQLGRAIKEAMTTVYQHTKKEYTKQRVATAFARHFRPERASEAISNQVTGLIVFLTENEDMLLINSNMTDFHASRVQELNWLTRVGSETDRVAINTYLKSFFERRPFGHLNPMTAVDCIKVYALSSKAEKPDPALIAELLATVKAEIRTWLYNHLITDKVVVQGELDSLVGSLDNYFTDHHDRFELDTWRAFMKTAGIKPHTLDGQNVRQFNSVIFRHELALKELHALLMDYGQFDEAIALLPQFLASENALVAVHNSQGDALVLNDQALFDRLLSEYFKAYGRKKYDGRDGFYRKFDDHFPYVCAVSTAIRYGRLAELKLSNEIRAAVRFSGHDLCERIETFLSQPKDTDWYVFGKELLTELLKEYKEPMSLIDGEDKMTDALRVLLYWKTH